MKQTETIYQPKLCSSYLFFKSVHLCPYSPALKNMGKIVFFRKILHYLNFKIIQIGIKQISFLIILSQMIENSIAYLVYFGCRGTGHYYRYALYQIGVPFEEIHISPDGTFPESLKDLPISLADLPCIILEGKIIKEFYPILRYLCRKYHRQDLLGYTLHEQTRISEIFSKSAKKKNNLISTILRYMPKIKKNPENIRAVKLEMLKELCDTQCCSEICSIMFGQTGGFIFDHLTIADFLFYENCFYFSSFFEDVCKKKMPIYLAYKNFFQRTDFYRKHKEKIQKFKVSFPQFDQGVNQGFRLMLWKEKKDRSFLQ